MTTSNALERATELLARMTLVEKTRQVVGVMLTSISTPEAMQERLSDGIGHLSAGTLGAESPKALADLNNGIQRFLVEGTRLGIPAMLHSEALNGFVAPGYTSFPTAIGLAATWNPDAVQEMADTIRRQMRSVGFAQALSPVVDIARDARWGRVHETYGEDVLLTSALGVAYVRGIQGDDLTDGVIATAKHFLGYAVSEGGLNTANSVANGRDLYDVYATPFEAMIKEAGLASVMNSYSDIDGVPAGANHAVLTDLLRGRMGFTGSVVSDYSTVEQLVTRQKVATTPLEAGVLALSAGLDVELPEPYGYADLLVSAVETGLLPLEVLDTAVIRALVDKIKTGLFENPFVSDDPIVLGQISQEGQELSKQLAHEAVTLLKNDGVLPLSDTLRKVAVIGPHADSAVVNFAGYTYISSLEMMRGLGTGEGRMAGFEALDDYIPVEVRAQLAAIDTEAIARTAYGATSLTDAIRDRLPNAEVVTIAGTGFVDHQDSDIPSAVALAADADVIIVAIGGHATAAGWDITEGEMTDSSRVELPSRQVELVQALAALGKPTVGVLYMGRPYAVADVDSAVSGLLTAYYAGPHGATAITSALFGDTNPCGKLPVTIPRATGQVPIYSAQKNGSGYRRAMADGMAGYVDLPATPLYPFGHGLSYTSFEYGDLTIGEAEVLIDGAVNVNVTITNTGDRAGTEIVQLYFSDTAVGVSRPELALVAFSRVSLDPGESATVEFTVQMSQLGYTGIDGRFVIEPGPIDVAIGTSSADLRANGSFTVVGQTRDLEGQRSYLPTVTIRMPSLKA